MKLAVAHVGGKYNYPGVSGEQFTEGCNAIWASGVRVLKVYCTSGYATVDYPRQTWTGTPTTMKELLQTPEFAAQLGRGWDMVIITGFSFGNNPGGTVTNWWRTAPTKAKMDVEYTELYDAAAHLMDTYASTGTEFRFQNWEGDWAYMDSFTIDTAVLRKYLDYYAAFLGQRQRAAEDARRDHASACIVRNVVEANRVYDARVAPHLRRICADFRDRISPDVVSWSAYDGTIVDQGGFGANLAAWTAATTPVMTKCLRTLKRSFPNSIIQIGEYGFPEGVELPSGRNVGDMIQVVYDIALAEGVDVLTYWQVFDNEESSPGVPRGFYTVKPDGSDSQAGTKYKALI